MNTQTDPAIPWRCRLLFRGTWSWDFATGAFVSAPGGSALAGRWLGMTEAVSRGSGTLPPGGREGCPASPVSCGISYPWQNKLLLIACPYGSGRGEIARPLVGALNDFQLFVDKKTRCQSTEGSPLERAGSCKPQNVLHPAWRRRAAARSPLPCR